MENSQIFEEAEHFVSVFVGAIAGDGALHNGETISDQVVSEVAISLLLAPDEETASRGCKCCGLSDNHVELMLILLLWSDTV
jgi:hypothetical protein